MADKKVETAEVTEETTGTAVGTRARRALMLRHFIPNPDWINQNVVAKGKGTQVTLGRIFGVCTGWEAKQNTLPDGKVVDSIVAKGTFQSESYLTGEVGDASLVFFPMAYAEKIKAVFESDASIKVLEVDCDVGLEATGKTIPYEWVVVAYREGEDMGVMKRIKASRGRPANAPALPAPAENKALPAA